MGENSAQLHEDPSSLSPGTIERHRAVASLMEELEAVDWYDQRVDATTDEALKEILAHNRDEEKEHAAMALEWLRRHDPVGEEAAMVVVDVGFDEGGHGVGHGVLDPAHGVGELPVGLPPVTPEQQTEGALVVGHELEIGGEARRHLLAGAAGGGRGLLDLLEQALADVAEELEVELALGAKVLVEHGLGDARGLGDLGHRGPVEAALGEHLEGDVEELAAALNGREAGL